MLQVKGPHRGWISVAFSKSLKQLPGRHLRKRTGKDMPAVIRVYERMGMVRAARTIVLFIHVPIHNADWMPLDMQQPGMFVTFQRQCAYPVHLAQADECSQGNQMQWLLVGERSMQSAILILLQGEMLPGH